MPWITYLAALIAALVCPGAGADDAEKQLAGMTWLEGRWVGKASDGSRVETIYSSPDGGMIVAATKEISGGKLALFDFEHIYVREGRLVMTPYPFGRRSERSFPLKALDQDARKAVFENLEHDFPQRFTYHRVADLLTVVLEGVQRGKPATARYDLTLAGRKPAAKKTDK